MIRTVSLSSSTRWKHLDAILPDTVYNLHCVIKQLIIFLAIFAGACSSFRVPEKIDPADFSVKLTRTECYGTCPVYTVTVLSNGKVQFVGTKNTKVAGPAEGTLGREKLDQLANEINNANIFSLKDSYTPDSGNCPSKATDNPTVTLEVTSGHLYKKIVHYLGCSEMKEAHSVRYPPGLAELENKIDEIIGTDRWIK